MNVLRWIRVVAGIAVLAAFCCMFVLDEQLVGDLYRVLPGTQLVPSLLSLIAVSGSVFGVSFIVIGLATLFVGRAYCSFLCPLGIVQDVLLRLEEWLKIRRRYAYQKPRPVLRYAILVIAGLSISSGFLTAVIWLDPYSLFGRMAYSLLSIPIRYLGQLIAPMAEPRGILVFSDLAKGQIPLFALVVGMLLLLCFAALTLLAGRFYCTTICPVGTLLGLLSRHSLLTIRIDGDTCVNCGRCERVCRSGCIDAKNGAVDHSRCVLCFDCLSACPKGAIGYRPRRAGPSVTPVGQRRKLLGGGLALAGFSIAPGIALRYAGASEHGHSPVMPPGAVSIARFKTRCTACHLCVSKCPTDVLQPSLIAYGVDGMLMPHLDFSRGYCEFDCNLCSQVCPNGAIAPITIEQKHTLQLGTVELNEDLCVSYTKNQDCGACIEHCPTHAIYGELKDGVHLPKVKPEGCVGCGACVHTCPEQAVRVIANAVHKQAEVLEQPEPPQYEETRKGEQPTDEFLF